MTQDSGATAASVPPTAVITGAGSGIGRSSAQALLAAGWRVAVSGRRENALKETVAGAPDESVLVFPADVTVPASVAALFGAVQDRWGRLDLLVNNAGVSTPGGAVDKIT